MNRLTPPGSESGRALGLALIFVVIGAVFGVALVRSSRPPVGERAGRPPETASPSPRLPDDAPGADGAERSVGAVPAIAPPPVERPDAPVRAVSAGLLPARPRSPLERAPGYYPPADPESLSVITGRREAPFVDLELSGGAPSVEALSRDLLAALSAGDEARLHALRVSREEFETIFWREFPQSRPITNIQASDAWELSWASSLAGASRAVGLAGGRPLDLVRVEVERSDGYRNFVLHRGVRIIARDRASGEEQALEFVPSVAERHGRFKALLFRD